MLLVTGVFQSRTSGRKSRGTPGFRAPEVILTITELLGKPSDVWSAGVILLSILSGRYPFFYSPDNLASLAEIICLVGTEPLIQLCKNNDIHLELPDKIGMDPVVREGSLKLMCQKLNYSSDVKFPDEAYDLLQKMLMFDPTKRITASDALKHNFLLGSFANT